jgi:hypothetical protein
MKLRCGISLFLPFAESSWALHQFGNVAYFRSHIGLAGMRYEGTGQKKRSR